MTVPFKKPNPPLSPSDLDDLERTLRVRLPGAYRDFLLKNEIELSAEQGSHLFLVLQSTENKM